MDSIYDLDNLEFEVTNRSMENELLEIFADEHLTAALRIVSTNILLPPDEKLIREALAIVVAMYFQRLKDGELNQNRMLH
jgi:hypothetical protein